MNTDVDLRELAIDRGGTDQPSIRARPNLLTRYVLPLVLIVGFLSLVAVIPTVVSSAMNIPFVVSAFLGGTGLLIVVSVTLDMVQRIEASLIMRNYGGFLSGDSDSGGGRIKGARG